MTTPAASWIPARTAPTMNAIDLFAGIGGAALGMQRAGFRHVAFCERDDFCLRVLAEHWTGVPCYPDVATIIEDMQADGFDETVDIVWASTPCQPASLAGVQRGTDDDRWLWPQTMAVVRALRPRWFVLENVPGLASLDGGLALDGICADLEGAGYSVQPVVVPAGAVDAPHRRERLFLLAHTDDIGEFGVAKGNANKKRIYLRKSDVRCGDRSEALADAVGAERGEVEPGGHDADRAASGREKGDGGHTADRTGREVLGHARGFRQFWNCTRRQSEDEGERGRHEGQFQRTGIEREALADADGAGHFDGWPAVPDVHGNWRRIPRDVAAVAGLRGSDDGFSARLDGHRVIWPTSPKHAEGKRTKRLQALGNAVVPHVAEMIGRAIIGAGG